VPAAELDTLRSEVDALRHELTEVQERLDFAERLLVREGKHARLPEPPG
jgi:hypothetical protein